MDRSALNILIVEDDPIIATDIKSLLISEGFKIAATATNATKALDYLKTKSPNFAILDIYLGTGQSGIDIAEVIHTNYNIPYIFLTSFSDEETLSAAQEQGPYGYLVKPFQDKTLVTTISTAWSNFHRSQKKGVIDFSKLEADLTEQEQTICTHLYKGASYKQICAALYISENTLKYHVKNIYSKLSIKGRSALAALINS